MLKCVHSDNAGLKVNKQLLNQTNGVIWNCIMLTVWCGWLQIKLTCVENQTKVESEWVGFYPVRLWPSQQTWRHLNISILISQPTCQHWEALSLKPIWQVIVSLLCEDTACAIVVHFDIYSVDPELTSTLCYLQVAVLWLSDQHSFAC